MVIPQEAYQQVRELGKIHANLLRELKQWVKPGVTTIDIEKQFIKLIKNYPNLKSACKGYHPKSHRTPYPTNLCIAVNEEAVHVPPHDRILKPGDIITIDLLLTDGTYITDAAISFIIQPEYAPDTRKKLLKCAYEALYNGISNAVPNKRVGDISYAIYRTVRKYGFDVLRDYGGHGIGKHIWEDPFIPNYGAPNSGPKLKVGQLLAIEPLVVSGKPTLHQIDDWATVTKDSKDFVQVEHTVLVTQNGPEIITKF